jgi:ribosomal protein L11 methyltransferase
LEKYYYELIVKPDLYYELFLDLASSLTQEAIQEQDESIIIRGEDEQNLQDIQDGMHKFAQELSIAFDTQIKCNTTLNKKENQDWVKIYQQSIKPIEVDDFYIYPSWEQPKKNKINIIIDPTLSFGSGHHETTSSCLKAILQYTTKDTTLCDVGAGSGILGIAAAKLKACVDFCDTDPNTIQDALKNYTANDTKPCDYWVGSAIKSTKTYDVVVANIVADVLAMISNDLKKITKPNGILILSGIMQQHSQKVLNKFKDYKQLQTIQQNEWITLVLQKDNNE